jgi:hypothetical protein
MTEKFQLLPSNYNNIKKTKMVCDGPLSKKRTIKPPFINECGFFMIIAGKPKSGKTTFAFDMLTNKDIYKKIFKNIIFVAPQSSRNSIDNNPLADLDNEFLFDELNDDVKTQILKNKEEYTETPEKHYQQLLLIDDCTSHLKTNSNIKMLNDLVFNRRHNSLCIILLTQYITSIPASVRSQYNGIVLFKPSKKDYDRINREFLFMKKNDFIDFVDFVFKDRHDNLFINSDLENDYYKNLQKIVFTTNIYDRKKSIKDKAETETKTKKEAKEETTTKTNDK